MENVISIGMRYGFSTFSQELNSFKIYNANPYFGEKPFILPQKILRIIRQLDRSSGE
jgi:hypothetical protein